MTKSNLIDRMCAACKVSTGRSEEIVNAIFGAIEQALNRGERVEIRGFGSFALNIRPPRTGRNPKSGDKVMVPEKRVPHFKPGKALRESVDNRHQDSPASADGVRRIG